MNTNNDNAIPITRKVDKNGVARYRKITLSGGCLSSLPIPRARAEAMLAAGEAAICERYFNGV